MTDLETVRWESEHIYAQVIDAAARQNPDTLPDGVRIADSAVLCEMLELLELRPVESLPVAVAS